MKQEQEQSPARIYIASNKLVPFPDNPAYQPVIVGRLAHVVPRTVVTDARGDNISRLNPYYCEMTALYWAWKNDDLPPYVGLAHYRRYLRSERAQGTKDFHAILQGEEVVADLQHADIILPKAWKVDEPSIAANYAHYHSSDDLMVLAGLLDEQYPAYVADFTAFMSGQEIYPCNIFVTRREIFCNYMAWLFPILREVERRVGGFADRDSYQRRAAGFLAERLLNVYVRHEHLRVKERGLVVVDGLSLPNSGSMGKG